MLPSTSVATDWRQVRYILRLFTIKCRDSESGGSGRVSDGVFLWGECGAVVYELRRPTAVGSVIRRQRVWRPSGSYSRDLRGGVVGAIAADPGRVAAVLPAEFGYGASIHLLPLGLDKPSPPNPVALRTPAQQSDSICLGGHNRCTVLV